VRQVPLPGFHAIQRGDRFRNLERWWYYQPGTVFEVGDRLEMPGRAAEYELIPIGKAGQSFAADEVELMTIFEREETR
jgi:hypothetical protein